MIKVIYVIGIIRGHRLFHEIVYPTYPTENAEIVNLLFTICSKRNSRKNFSVAIFLSFYQIYQSRDLTAISLTAVDIFFMLSGFLMFHLGYENMKKSGAAYLVLSVVIKWIR